MNDPSQMMNQSQMMNKSQMMNQSQVLNPSQMLSMSQPQMLNHQHVMNQKSQMLSQPQLMNQSQMMMSQSQPQMSNRGYAMWPPVDQLKFQNPMKFPGFVSSSKQSKPLGRSNWKGKKGNDKRKDGRRKENQLIGGSSSTIGVGGGGGGGGIGVGGGGSGGGGYQPPTLKELQHQNRLKARRYFPKKKFNNRSAPLAPRNTTSFIIRAKKSGGIASLVSPCPVTPAVLPTPIFSPSREALVDTAKEEWGVDGYGSMKGLIRLRSPGNELDGNEDEEEDEGGSSESDVEEHLEVERRLDHDLSRFEMIYPNYGVEYNNILENRVDDQDTHIAQVEEENLILKERLFLMERELGDLRRRLLCLERQNQTVDEINEEVVENGSDNESESRGYSRSMEENNDEVLEENNEGGRYVEAKEENNDVDVEVKDANKVETPNALGVDVCMEENNEGGRFLEAKEENNGVVEEKGGDKLETPNTIVVDVCTEDLAHAHDDVIEENQSKGDGAGNECSETSIGDGDLSSCPVLM